MTVVATASNPRFSVSRVDIDRDRPHLHRRHADGPARRAPRRGAVLHHRRRRAGPDPVLAPGGRAVRAGALRRGHPVRATSWATTTCRTERSASSRCPAMAISSTDCRRRVAAGRPVWYLVPDGVVQYISKRHLYQTAAGGRADPRSRPVAQPATASSTVLNSDSTSSQAHRRDGTDRPAGSRRPRSAAAGTVGAPPRRGPPGGPVRRTTGTRPPTDRGSPVRRRPAAERCSPCPAADHRC